MYYIAYILIYTGSLNITGAVGRSNITHTIISPTLDTFSQVNRFIVSYQRQDLNALDVEYQEVVVTGENLDIVKETSIPGVMYLVMWWSVNGSQYSPTPLSLPAILLQIAQGR